ncbi:hypothetical protein B1U23_01205 [Borreliella burgdorferi]|uniref:Uncharacterized protein n=5 Tax=Borreliella burgdorferi TaxID=139 RepID=O51258_BORBU|nr:conserved hypothetical protein [Borreliella burgdorferi B31]AAO37933.1 hypothetical protein BB0242 [Borreliella burgdorferi]ADQ29482.1 conserved hypothetical protein [Borreliella burgdorferi N40]ADQ31029.1 conserved hypothetical protein [Borreliella burgdorferi JD1]AGS66261.1 hypothetical protein L144_01190 [Borreliella burgdorferi CA382]
MHNLFDFLKLKQHIIKMFGKQINQLYKQLLIKFFHLHLLILCMYSKNKLSKPFEKVKFIGAIQKMINNILNLKKNHKKLKNLPVQLVYSAIQ